MSASHGRLHAINMAQTQSTRNSLRAGARQSSIDALDGIVACTMDVSLAARQAHWNVRGRQFSALHDLFGRISADLARHVDVLAERAAALGGMPRCTAQSVAAVTRLKPYPSFGVAATEHIVELASRIAALGAELRDAAIDTGKQGDPVTAHLLTEACVAAEHLLWLLESQLPVDGADGKSKLPA